MKNFRLLKDISLDLEKENISENVKTVLLEQVKIIEHQKQEITALQRENEELKKTSPKPFLSRCTVRL